MQDPSSPVFFLPWVGAEQGTYVTVTCIVPHNKAILISVDSGTADYSDPTVKLKTPSELIRLVTESNKYPNEFDATLDGHSLDLINDEAHKVTSDLFNLTLPKDNVWGEPEGPDKDYYARLVADAQAPSCRRTHCALQYGLREFKERPSKYSAWTRQS